MLGPNKHKSSSGRPSQKILIKNVWRKHTFQSLGRIYFAPNNYPLDHQNVSYNKQRDATHMVFVSSLDLPHCTGVTPAAQRLGEILYFRSGALD